MLNIAHRATEKEFAHFDLFYRDSKQKVQADRVNILGFLQDRGYYIYRTSVSKHIFIRIIDNIVKEVGKKDIVDEVNNWVKEHETRNIYEAFLANVTKFFNDDFLRSLPARQVEFRKDKKDAMQLYYQNCIVKITGKLITEHEYSALNGFIWESQILNRDFKQTIIDSDFKTFCFNICDRDNKRYASLCSMIGFLIHNFKNPKNCPAVILNDEIISDNPEGGTGKGLLIKAIMRFMKTTVIEGKTFTFDKGFVYQDVNADTKIIAFQDVKNNFDFERLFSVLTDGITVEKKGLQSIHYDFENSPKVIISTNKAIKGSGNSHKRRRFEVEISQYYNENKTPGDDFEKMFFDEWDKDDFLNFDNFIIECCQYYLNKGLVQQELINLPEKRLIIETNSDFLEFMLDFKFEMEVGKNSMLDQFIDKYKKYHRAEWLTTNHFSKWVVKYCEFHKITVDTTKRDRTGSIRVYRFDNFPLKVSETDDINYVF